MENLSKISKKHGFIALGCWTFGVTGWGASG